MEAPSNFHDFLPIMAQRLGHQGLMEELAKGFQLLADPSTSTITFASLKRNAPQMGLQEMSDDELRDMIRMGDTDGSGSLTLEQFCVVMIRSSPSLMEQAEELLEDVLSEAFDADDMEDDWV